MPAMVVNDDSGNLTPRGDPASIASKLAPTEAPNPVGASLLAKVVNDNAENLTPRSDPASIASLLAPTETPNRPAVGPT